MGTQSGARPDLDETGATFLLMRPTESPAGGVLDDWPASSTYTRIAAINGGPAFVSRPASSLLQQLFLCSSCVSSSSHSCDAPRDDSASGASRGNDDGQSGSADKSPSGRGGWGRRTHAPSRQFSHSTDFHSHVVQVVR